MVRHPLVSKIIKAYQNKSIDDKINVITNNNILNFFKKPNNYLDKKIIKLNKIDEFKRTKSFTLLLSDDKHIRCLNKKFRKK